MLIAVIVEAHRAATVTKKNGGQQMGKQMDGQMNRHCIHTQTNCRSCPQEPYLFLHCLSAGAGS